MDFQVRHMHLLSETISDISKGIIMFLQSLPTQTWGDHEIEVLLAEAYVLSSVWHNAQSHLLKGS